MVRDSIIDTYKCFKPTGFPVTDEQVDDYEDEDDTPLSLLAQQLRVDQSILQNVHIELPTEENTGDWERTFHVYMI